MSPVNRYAASHAAVGSSTTPRSPGRPPRSREPERGDRVEQPAGAGDHPYRRPGGSRRANTSNDALAVGGAVAQRGRDHGQLVVIGEQRGAHPVVQPHVHERTWWAIALTRGQISVTVERPSLGSADHRSRYSE
jgi:hypothetical protein